MEPYKYFNNFIEMPVVLIVFLVGVVLVLFGIGKTLLKKTFDKGIWFVGIGTGMLRSLARRSAISMTSSLALQ